MRAARLLLLTLVTGAALALAACASTGAQGGEDTFSVPIEVDNNLPGLAGVTVYISRPSGTGRRLLGPIESGDKRTFTYDGRTGTYRLIAKQGVGLDSLVSDQFRLDPGTVVQWSLASNVLMTGSR